MMTRTAPARPQQPAGAPHRVRLKALWAAVWLLATVPAWAQGGSAALPAVVVWDFDNQSPPGATAPGGGGDFLKRTLSESITAQLLQVPGLPVVERQRLKDLLAEQKVSAADLADEDSRVRLGRIVGAGRMVFGGFFVLGTEVQVHVRVVDTATSRVLFSDESQSALASVMQQVEPMNRRLARALAGAGAATGVATAAASQASWQAYDDALALADAGRLDDAVRALQALLARDKTFTPAERQLMALLDKLARR
jgi:TolB-like protein